MDHGSAVEGVFARLSLAINLLVTLVVDFVFSMEYALRVGWLCAIRLFLAFSISSRWLGWRCVKVTTERRRPVCATDSGEKRNKTQLSDSGVKTSRSIFKSHSLDDLLLTMPASMLRSKLREFVRLHGILENIIFDRAFKFLSYFLEDIGKPAVKTFFSTTCHPKLTNKRGCSNESLPLYIGWWSRKSWRFGKNSYLM